MRKSDEHNGEPVVYMGEGWYRKSDLERLLAYFDERPVRRGCDKRLAKGQYWNFCGETDMGQTPPVLCKECDPINGYELAEKDEMK